MLETFLLSASDASLVAHQPFMMSRREPTSPSGLSSAPLDLLNQVEALTRQQQAVNTGLSEPLLDGLFWLDHVTLE